MYSQLSGDRSTVDDTPSFMQRIFFQTIEFFLMNFLYSEDSALIVARGISSRFQENEYIYA